MEADNSLVGCGVRGYGIVILVLALSASAADAADEIAVSPQKSAGEKVHYPRLTHFPDTQIQKRVNDLLAAHDKEESENHASCQENLRENHQKMAAFPVSDQGQVTEWFKRVADDVIDYRFEVKDPVYYTQTWTGQMPMRFSKEQVYEYACHEGNYALPGILIGMNAGRDTALDAEGE